MKKYYHLLVSFLLITSLIACKKSSDNPTNNQNNNNNNNTNNQQGKYTGNAPAISQSTNLDGPWVVLSADSVYTGNAAISPLFKPIPTGYENKIISVFIPKGYMLVVAENQDGTGENSTLVANVSDVKVNLPNRLRNNISYIRFIKLNNPEKKGTASVSNLTVQSLAAQWYYGWSLNQPSYTGQQFVPMTWGKGSCIDDNVKYLVERNDIDHLLSFNEPDNTSQSNIPNIDTAIARYKIMQKSGLRLGSPVVTQDQAFGSGKWLTDFMAKAQAQKLRIDFICVHWYDWGNQTNNAATDSLTAEKVFNRFVAYIQNVHTNYPAYPIWVTEYNANINRTSETIHKYFMRLSTEWMNTTSYVERYSYFFPSILPATNTDNSLTIAGAYWQSLPSVKAFSINIINDAVLIN
jgi:hypothetical protein